MRFEFTDQSITVQEVLFSEKITMRQTQSKVPGLDLERDNRLHLSFLSFNWVIFLRRKNLSFWYVSKIPPRREEFPERNSKPSRRSKIPPRREEFQERNSKPSRQSQGDLESNLFLEVDDFIFPSSFPFMVSIFTSLIAIPFQVPFISLHVFLRTLIHVLSASSSPF